MTGRAVEEVESFRDQIARTALRLMDERHADRLSLSDVMKSMGITRATMARYCPSEDDLWLAVVTLINRRMQKLWSTISVRESSPSARLHSLLAVQIHLITTLPALRILLLKGSLDEDMQALRLGLKAIRRGFMSHLAEQVREGQRLQEFPSKLDPEVTADCLLGAIQGMVVSHSLNQETHDPVEEIHVQLDTFLYNADSPTPGGD